MTSKTKMIDCEEALNRLLEFLDGELDASSGREVEHHLERCRSCFSRAEFERRLKIHLRDLGQTPVSPELEQRIRTLMGQFLCL